jgi:GT2 family glycosyltransferase
MKVRLAPAPTNGHTRPAGLRPASPQRLVVAHATWLGESDMLLIGSLPAPVAAALDRRDPGPGKPRFLVLPARRGEPDPESTRVLVHWPVQRPLPPAFSTAGAPSVRIAAGDVDRRVAGVRDFAREGLAWHDPRTRADVLEFAVSVTSRRAPERRRSTRAGELVAVDRDVRISAALHDLRQALRERLPVSITPGGPVALVDAVARLDRDAFFMRGRIGVGTSELGRVTAVSPEGCRVELLEKAYWYGLSMPGGQRGDNAWQAFSVFFTCAPSLRLGGWILELETRSGELLEVGAPNVAAQPAEVIRIVLEDLAVEPLPATRLRTTQLVPAIRRLQRARVRAAALETVKQFGVPPPAPVVSVIIPLYRRIDLIEHQMTQFADDRQMQSVDLIYVLDSPELEDELLEMARRLYPLYRQPFRVAVVSANVGFAGANNLGASIARGRLILLLNSDVFPEKPGWLDAMVRFHDSLPNPGAIGPKLLYEDDTIQHAGMFFERLSDTQPWSNEHHFKGMHRDLPAATPSRPVPAVTGACLMVDRALYVKLGGLSGDYVQGDFEDSELCLRLLDAGRQNWYFADVALYHLEASSYDPERRRVHDGFNRWLHTHLWSERLSALGGPATARVASSSPAPVLAAVGVDAKIAAGAPSGS